MSSELSGLVNPLKLSDSSAVCSIVIGGMDRTLEFRVDYIGVSDAGQATTRGMEKRLRAWRFAEVIDAAYHQALIDASGEVF